MSFKTLAWNSVTFSWIAAPVAGFWPGSHPRAAQMALWVLASCAVISAGSLKPVVRDVEPLHYLMVAFLAVFLMHGLVMYNEYSFMFGTSWLMKAVLILAAAIFIGQRESWRTLFRYLVILFLLQIPVAAWQAIGLMNPWSNRVSGTLPVRAGLSMLAALVCLWADSRWLSGLGLLMSCASRSVSGAVAAVGKFLSERFRVRFRWKLAVVGAVMLIAAPPLLPRLTARLEAWSSLSFLKFGWLTGWGFLPFPGGFREDAHQGGAYGSLATVDYHCVWLDWVGRFGLVGLVAIAPFVAWVVKSTKKINLPWAYWTAVLAAVAGTVQSAEYIAAMCLFGIVWVIRLNEEVKLPC